MKKLLCALLFLPILAWAADIAVTPGVGKTVATTTDAGREFQNIIVTTSSVNNVSNVPVAVGWQVGGGSVPVHEAGTANVNITAGSIANTGFNVNNAPSITAITNALPTGTNNIGTVSGSTMSLQSGGVAITQTGGALDLNIKSGSIANTGFNVNNTPSVLVGTVTIATPVNNTTNLPVTVSNTGFNVNNTPTVLVGTVTISAPVNNTVPIPVTGSFSATSVNYSTYTYGNLIGTIGTAVGGIGPNGQFSTFAVDSSSSVNVHITAGAGSGGTSSNYKAVFPVAGTAVGGTDAAGNFEPFKVSASSEIFVTIVTTSVVVPPNGFNWPITGSISNTGFNVNNNVTLNALPTGTNNIGTVSGSTTVIQGSNGGGVTATAGALDINIKSGSIANTGFNVNNSPTVLPGNTANTTPWLMTSSITVTDISGANRTVGYASMNSSVPVNVINTPAVSQSGTWNVGTVTTLTGITNALPAGTNNIGTIGNLNGVVISSFAVSSTPMVNLTLVSSNAVATAGGNAGELRISAEVSGTSNTFQGGLAHNGVAAATNRVGTLPALSQTTFANGTVLTAGRDAALSVGTDGNLWVSQQPPMRPASFYASISSASYTSTTDLACLPGNATNTVIVRRIVVSCTETTAGQVTLSVIRRSAADSGGTSASMLVGKDDSTSGSAVSVPLVYSAAPTKGTLDSFADIQTIGCMASATASPNDVLIENWNDKAKVLRGTAQEFCVSLATPQDLAGVTVTGGNFNVHFEWDEIASFTP